jgi:hypothetical protein
VCLGPDEQVQGFRDRTVHRERLLRGALILNNVLRRLEPCKRVFWGPSQTVTLLCSGSAGDCRREVGGGSANCSSH